MQFVRLTSKSIGQSDAEWLRGVIEDHFDLSKIDLRDAFSDETPYQAMLPLSTREELIKLVSHNEDLRESVVLDLIDVDEETGEITDKLPLSTDNKAEPLQNQQETSVEQTLHSLPLMQIREDEEEFTIDLPERHDVDDVMLTADQLMSDLNPALGDIPQVNDAMGLVAIQTQITSLNTLYALMNKSIAKINRDIASESLAEFKLKLETEGLPEIDTYSKLQDEYEDVLKNLETNARNIKISYDEEFATWLDDQIIQLKQQYLEMRPDTTDDDIEQMIIQHQPVLDDLEQRIDHARDEAKLAVVREFAAQAQDEHLVDAMTFVTTKLAARQAVQNISDLLSAPQYPSEQYTNDQYDVQDEPVTESYEPVAEQTQTEPDDFSDEAPLYTEAEWADKVNEELGKMSNAELQDLYLARREAEERGETFDVASYLGLVDPQIVDETSVEADEIDASVSDDDIDDLISDVDLDDLDALLAEEDESWDDNNLTDDAVDEEPVDETQFEDTSDTDDFSNFDEFAEFDQAGDTPLDTQQFAGASEYEDSADDDFDSFADDDYQGDPVITEVDDSLTGDRPQTNDLNEFGEAFDGSTQEIDLSDLTHDDSTDAESMTDTFADEFEDQDFGDEGDDEDDEPKSKKGKKSKKSKKSKKKKPRKEKSGKSRKKLFIFGSAAVGVVAVGATAVALMSQPAKVKDNTQQSEQTSEKKEPATSENTEKDVRDFIAEAKSVGVEPGQSFNVFDSTGQIRVKVISMNSDGSATVEREDGSQDTISYQVMKAYVDSELEKQSTSSTEETSASDLENSSDTGTDTQQSSEASDSISNTGSE